MTQGRFLLIVVFFLVPTTSVIAQKPATGPWDMRALSTVEVKPEWGKEVGKFREVHYPGESYQGKPTRVFAYFAKPAAGEGPFPASCSFTVGTSSRFGAKPSSSH